MLTNILAFIGKRAGAGACFALGLMGTAYALTSLQRDITATGIDQPTLVDFLGNVVTKVNAIDASVDSDVTLATELRTDHATFKTAVDELITDHDADNAGVVADLKTLANDMRTYLTGDRLWSGNPALAIDTNFDVQTANAVVVSIDGVLASVAAATCDTGAAATLAADTWGVFLVTSDSSGTLTCTWDTNSGSGYASEALAIAALPAAPASEAPIGYVTVQTASGQTFTAGTDALTTGTGGNPANATNYYNLADPLSTVSAAVSSSPAASLSAATPATLSAAAPTAVSDTDDLTLSRP